MEGHWKFLGGGGGVLKAKFFEAMYENKPEFPGGGGCKTKNLPWGEYGYFLELHISYVTYLYKIVLLWVLCEQGRGYSHK